MWKTRASLQSNTTCMWAVQHRVFMAWVNLLSHIMLLQLFITSCVHLLHPIVWDFFSRYKQSFLPGFVYASACQRSASDCLSALLLLLPHPVYRSLATVIASRLLSRTSHSTSGCFSHINLRRLSGAKRLPCALVLRAAFATAKLSFCFLGCPNGMSWGPLCENTAESYSLSYPLQRA